MVSIVGRPKCVPRGPRPTPAAVQHLEGLVARLAEERVVQLAAQEVALEADLDRWARLEEQLRQPRAEARPARRLGQRLGSVGDGPRALGAARATVVHPGDRG